LNIETTDRTNGDATLTTNLNTEVARATNVEATKEDVANKSTDVTADGSSDTKYSSVKSVKDYVDAASTGSSTALTTEITNRTNADDSIKTNLNNETTRATNAENTLTTNLNIETTDRTNGDATLTTNLNTEVARATNVEATKEDVANKSTDVTTDGSSNIKYPSVKSIKDYIDAASTGGLTALATEITNRTNADDSIK